MAFHILKNILYILICVASFSSNSLLIVILLRFEHLRTTANLFVLNLAFCDVATVLLSIPFTIGVEESISYPFGEVGCKILMPGATAAFNSAAFTLLAIAIDRFYAIMFPMRARLQSWKTKALVLCVLHGLSVCSVIPFSIHQKYIKGENGYKCIEQWPGLGSRIYTLALFMIQYFIPLTVIAVLYSISWNQIRKKNKVIIKMQEVQQKGKCHFSRSQSWDIAMKKSDSFQSASEGQEMKVINSMSNYSFKSSQLQAVEEGRGDGEEDDAEGIDDNCDDIDRNCDSGGAEDSIINAKGVGQARKGRRVVKHEKQQMNMTLLEKTNGDQDQKMNESMKENKKNDVSKKSKTTTRKGDDGLARNTKKGQEKNNNRSSFPLQSYREFTAGRQWIKSPCMPQWMKIPWRKSKTALKGKKGNGLGGNETHLLETVAGHGVPLGGSTMENVDIEDDVFTEESGQESYSTQVTMSVPDKLADESRITQSGIDALKVQLIEMSHSVSSPILSVETTAKGNTRRESSPAALHKSLSHGERRQSRLSQLALQAKRRISQALTTSSSENTCTLASVKRMKQTRRTLRMFTIVVVVFAVCFLPNQITWIWMAFNGAHLSHVLYSVFYFLTYTNSVINPWIYGAVNPSFRKAYRKVFCCKAGSDLSRNNPSRSSSKMTQLFFSRRSSDNIHSSRN